MAEEKAQKERPEFIEHLRAARRATMRQWGSLIPKEFWEHGREARREFLLALRAAVDSAIERLEEADEEAPQPRARRKTKVEFEAD